jgi:hypothetical protein
MMGLLPSIPPDKLSTLSFVSRTFSSTATVVAPAGIRGGDLLLFMNQADGHGSDTPTVPSGFTLLMQDNDSGTNMQFNTSRKIADGTESGTNIVGLAGSSMTRTCLMIFRGNVAVRAVSAAGGVTQESTTGNPSGQSVNTAGAVVPFIDFGWGFTGTSGDLTDVDLPNSETNGVDDRMVVGYVLHNTVGIGGGGYNIGDGGLLNYLGSLYISLS